MVVDLIINLMDHQVIHLSLINTPDQPDTITGEVTTNNGTTRNTIVSIIIYIFFSLFSVYLFACPKIYLSFLAEMNKKVPMLQFLFCGL